MHEVARLRVSMWWTSSGRRGPRLGRDLVARQQPLGARIAPGAVEHVPATVVSAPPRAPQLRRQPSAIQGLALVVGGRGVHAQNPAGRAAIAQLAGHPHQPEPRPTQHVCMGHAPCLVSISSLDPDKLPRASLLVSAQIDAQCHAYLGRGYARRRRRPDAGVKRPRVSMSEPPGRPARTSDEIGHGVGTRLAKRRLNA